MATYQELKRRHAGKEPSETVLVLQGGGSLGAYECGVFKGLTKEGIFFDVVSGTSIGAINAGIIAASEPDEAVTKLENFWLEISENVTPPYYSDYARAMFASGLSGMYGNPKAFFPRWMNVFQPNGGKLYQPKTSGQKSADSLTWPYLYTVEPLKKTLSRYIDYNKLANKESFLPRLIITSTDILTSEPVIFDSYSMRLDADHLVACVGFPFYGIEWTHVDGKYLWDGSLLSNTPLREVIDASPKRDKRVFIVNLFPRVQDTLPENLADSWHRARDIMYTDRTDQNVRMSKIVTRYLLLLKEMHDILSKAELNAEMKSRFLQIQQKYCALAEERGAIISEIVKVERKEDVHFLFEDADFSTITIKKLIAQGEREAREAVVQNRKKEQAQQ